MQRAEGYQKYQYATVCRMKAILQRSLYNINARTYIRDLIQAALCRRKFSVKDKVGRF